MSAKFVTAAHHINNALVPAEQSSSTAAIASARLLCTMLEQHQSSGAKGNVGLSAISLAARAAALQVEAREAQIRAHGAMNIDLKKVGLEGMYGKEEELPPNGPPSPTNPFTSAELSEPKRAVA